MLRKDICKLCYQFHEMVWDEFNDEEWEEGYICCPVDYFQAHDSSFEDTTEGKLLGAIRGCRKTSGEIPIWCTFQRI